MANPQAEDGHIDLANEIVEALAKIRISGEEMQCLWVIFRKTYGWHKKEDCISLSQFFEMTTLKKPHVCRSLSKLLSKKIIGVTKNGNGITSYGFNKDFDSWESLPKKVTLSKMVKGSPKKGKASLPLLGHTKETTTKETITKEIYTSNFLSFWNKYPKKVGKPNTFKEWNRIKPDLKTVLSALKAQIEQKERLLSENKFCPEWPDPERWIKNQRWLDEIQDGAPLDATDRLIYEMKKEREKNGDIKPAPKLH